MGNRSALKEQVAFLIGIEATEAIEKRCLARTIGTNEAANLIAWHIKANTVERDNAAKTHGDSLNRQQAVGSFNH
jgi:hypothetical protein